MTINNALYYRLYLSYYYCYRGYERYYYLETLLVQSYSYVYLFLHSLPVLHCQVLGDQSVLSDMRCATAQDSAAVEHQVWNFIIILSSFDRCIILWRINLFGVCRRDKILERLVYKIVPGLHAKEMARRALPNTELYLSPDDLISLVLQYHVEDTAR